MMGNYRLSAGQADNAYLNVEVNKMRIVSMLSPLHWYFIIKVLNLGVFHCVV